MRESNPRNSLFLKRLSHAIIAHNLLAMTSCTFTGRGTYNYVCVVHGLRKPGQILVGLG